MYSYVDQLVKTGLFYHFNKLFHKLRSHTPRTIQLSGQVIKSTSDKVHLINYKDEARQGEGDYKLN